MPGTDGMVEIKNKKNKKSYLYNNYVKCRELKILILTQSAIM